MPIVFAFVLGLSFLVLMVAFRSIVIPFMSIFMNLLSVGAAYGLLVLAFQEGYGEFLGLVHTPVIEAWIPVFLFCVLFGLVDGLPLLPAEPDPGAFRPDG
jgi:putative drug exporter of the RND superfamily